MLRKAGLFGWLTVLLITLFPAITMAAGLKLEEIELPKEGTPAEEAHLSVYFDMRAGDNSTIVGIEPENCQLTIENKTFDITKENGQIREFVDGNKDVGILFIFPKAKNYSEEDYQFRQNLVMLLQRIKDRGNDKVNAIPFDSGSATLGWSNSSDQTLIKQLNEEVQNSDVTTPNVFSSFNPALAALESLNGVSYKYVVIITDSLGDYFGEGGTNAQRAVGNFVTEISKDKKVTPIIIGYTADDIADLADIGIIKRIATNTGGPYYEAHSVSEFTQIITRDVYDYIYKRYILDVTLNMDGSNYLEADNYPVQLVVKINNKEEKAGIKINWPELSKNRTTLWLVLGGILLLVIAGVIIVVIRRNNEEEPIDIVDTAPQDVCCATCGKTIPQQLYGFKGEFCLSGGLPDCPYYQMPDKGKIQITRGVLADVTFFIKKDVTTIGSNADNDIYLNDKTVSRKHAAIKTDEGKRYEIRDFGSSNGLYINDEKTERKFLRDGDRIRFGTVETVFKLK